MQRKPGSDQLVIDRQGIQVWDDVIDPQLCAQMIQDFERSHTEHREVPTRLIELEMINRTVVPQAHQTVDWTGCTDQLMATVSQLAELYRSRWDPLQMMPPQYAAEGFRLKCYRPGEHEFRMHVDVANRDSSTRFLAFLIYVNDSEAGTEFPLLDLTVEARQGRILIFPPTWQYPHRGIMPHSDSKYITSTYFHYAY